MSTRRLHESKLGFGGGEITLNAECGGFTVDVWTDDEDEPIAYHAWHGSEEEARADFDSWAPWPE